MARALLIIPPFWDPVCVPLGVASLKAYAEAFGHHVELFDFNTLASVFGAQRAYFAEGRRQLPHWDRWYIERNGAETLALHQLVYMAARHRGDYRELVAEVLNLDDRPLERILERIDVRAFDAIFDGLYARISVRFERLLAETQPDVVGCTLLNSTWPGSLFLLRRAKELLPGVRTVVGGPGPLGGIASRADEVQTFFDHHEFVDHYVVGEGERPFLRILEDPTLPRCILDPQRSLALADAKRDSLALTDMPAPDYGKLPVGRYLHLSVSSSRGCPFECSFCAETVFWKGFRRLPASDVFERIDHLGQRHGRTSYFVCDSLSNHVIGPLTARIAESGRPYKLDCHLRADPICTDEKRTRAWHEGGLFRARLGMESASQRILDAMVKKTDPENMAASIRALASQGIMTTTLWLIHYPGETDSEFASTLAFLRENARWVYQADAQVFQFHPEGLAHSREIDEASGSRFRFSPALNDLLGVSAYVVDRDFSLGEAYDRLERFVACMRELGIPNPYKMPEWIAAEDRWKGLGHHSGWTPRKSLLAMHA